MKTWFKNQIWFIAIPVAIVFSLIVVIYLFVDPAPPKHFTIATGEEDSNYFHYAKAYEELIGKEGIHLDVLKSKGAWDNIKMLEDPKSGVEAAFVQDGLGTRQKHPDLTSLGSVFYEPIWVFYRGASPITRFLQLKNKKVAVGETGGETHTMAKKLLQASGVSEKDCTCLEMDTEAEIKALEAGTVDAAFFIAAPDNDFIVKLIKDENLHLMSVDQAEAMTRQFPYLHHLVLPHGTFDLQHNLPSVDIDLIAPTATLLVRNDFHPALIYLLLKAASKVHRGPGIFEKRHEFPTDKDYIFPLNTGAKNYYQSGAPFWLRYLPFWLATLVERFIFLVIPMAALIIPVIRAIPRFMQWRIRNRIYQRYGELKFLESKIREDLAREKYRHHLEQLDKIEDRVNHMKVPLDFSEYVYSLRGHIQFVRDRLQHLLQKEDGLKS